MESTSIELLHSIQLDMLVKFDKFCSENQLTYFLDSGTALGAVRHHGFIPWDDDVDVAMPRDDYNRLLELGESGLPENLFLQTYKTDPFYFNTFGKIRLGNSYFPDTGVDRMKYKGIYIDVFPYDKVPNNKLFASLRIWISRFFWFSCVFCLRDYPGKNFILKVWSDLLHQLSRKGRCRLYKFYDWFCSRFNSKKTTTWTCYCWNMTQHSIYLFKYTELFPTIKCIFEGNTLHIMQDAHSYLSKMYGNYSVLPPIEKRKSHLKGSFLTPNM